MFAIATYMGTDLHQVVTSLESFLFCNIYTSCVMARVKGITVMMFKCMKFMRITSPRCGTALKELYFSTFIQHIMRGISMKELLAEKSIYQPGTARKVYVHVTRIQQHLHHCFHTGIKTLSCNLSELLLVSTGRHTTTISNMLQCGMQYDILLGSTKTTDQVLEHCAVVSQQSCLVNLGDYVELVMAEHNVRH